MKKKKVIWVLLALCLIVSVGLGVFALMNRGNEQLYRAVRNHVREHGESAVALGELMNFDWEQALYFDYTNPWPIYEAIGVHFSGTDLTRGILFIRDGEIVYYEYFPQRGIWIDIHPVRLSMRNVGQGVRIFERNDIFIVGLAEDYFGNRLYWLRAPERH